MSVFGAALITFFCIFLMTRHLSPTTMRRLVGYAGWCDLVIHGSILYMFLGTSTLGLMQAELSGLMFTCYLRWYRSYYGYERFTNFRWVRVAGTKPIAVETK